MSEQKKLSLYIGIPAYGGNGGVSSLYPEIARWLAELTLILKSDERIGEVHVDFHADCPITMVRNGYVEKARKAGCQLLLMVDSDQNPNHHLGESWYKPFFPEAFNALYEHYEKGPLVIGAPYCGPPGSGENTYVFFWENHGIRGDETAFKMEQYPRAIAAQMRGIQPVAALPTGMILFDMRIFGLLDVNRKSKEQVLEEFKGGRIGMTEALRCIQDGYFYYEWTDHTASDKASTEDVTATRDMSIIGQVQLGYNPVLCAWDSWVGHMKPMCVGKPKNFTVEQIGGVMKRAVLDGHSYWDEIRLVRNEALLKELGKSNGHPAS
jgi:hypothetical protein